MTTITSLNDLIQKISNEDNCFFSGLRSYIECNLSYLKDSTDLVLLDLYERKIYGIFEILYYTHYISSDEIASLRHELNSLFDIRSEYIISHIYENTEGGD